MLEDGDIVEVLGFTTGAGQDHRWDLYSAGRLLVELLTGSPRDPAGMEKIVRTALHPDLAERYRTAETFMVALWEWKRSIAPEGR